MTKSTIRLHETKIKAQMNATRTRPCLHLQNVIGRFLILIIMHKKFVIKHVRTSSWVDLDYHTGDEVIYVKSFLTALTFDTKDKAKDFCFRHKLDLGNHELFQLEVLASPRRWV